MRKNFRPSLLAVVAMMGMVSFTSCSSSDDPSDEPSVNPGEAVKTAFTLSVGLPQGRNAAAKPATRVADDIAQASSNFRGIDNINLIPFNTMNVDGNSTPSGNNILLPNAVNNSLTTGQLVANNNSRVYNDVSISVGTNHFLFYGKAVDANPGVAITTPAEKFKYGHLTVAGLVNTPSGSTTSESTVSTVNNISFTPEAIYTGNDVSSITTASALVAYLNSIVNTKYTPTSGAETSWASYASASNNRPLANLYNNFTTITAGSSNEIQAAVQDLYESLQNLTTGENAGNNLTDDEDKLRNAIVTNIMTKATASTVTSTQYEHPLTFDESLNDFPGSLNLPDGAASLTFTAGSNGGDGQFQENAIGMTLQNGTQVASLNSFAYPANLWYFANTNIKTSQKALSDQYTSNNANWTSILNQYDEGDGVVSPLTRSIALTDQIQYAVARLQTKITAASTNLLDKDGQTVTVGAETFPVTGIIIGGQRQVNWKFEPVTTATSTENQGTATTQYSMYDKVDNRYATTTGSTANSTMVLETPANEKVNIVVELQNNSGKQFKGVNGYIPVGGKFYLVAQLDPTDNTKTTQPNGSTLNQVFKQDYVTTANLTISQNSGTDHTSGLGAAYNVIPDLRTPVLSIGMSVDLTWQSGLTFNVDM